MEHGRDPCEIVTQVVKGIDPTVHPHVVVGAMGRAATKRHQQHRLAWAIEDRPELLTGEGASAPIPSVLRLIDALLEAGVAGVVRPACPHCGRVITLSKSRGGVRLCRNCVAKARAERCSGCGALREPATRDASGAPLCPNCLISDPTNQETCTSCGRRRCVSVRTEKGPLCPTCRPGKTMTCTICGHHGPAMVSETTGLPWCRACTQRWARCVRCGEVAPLRGGTIEEPLCATCTRPEPGFWRGCTDCGELGRIHAGRCTRCAVKRRLTELLGDADGHIGADLRPFCDALASAERPDTVAAWLDKSATTGILGRLQAGTEVTHEQLDALAPGKPVEHLRSVLVAVGTLPARDEQMTRLERWVAETVTARTDVHEQEVLRRYAVWHVLRRLRRRLNGVDATHAQLVNARQHVRGAVTVLDWFTANGLTLATAGQGDLEVWLSSDVATHRREAGHFLR